MSRPNPNLVVAQERCPKCAELGKDTSKDNLAVYEDGHSHCFGCNYHIFSDGATLNNLKYVMAQKDEDVKPKIISLPADSSKTIDAKALNWLAEYGIIRQEIIDNDLRWSDNLQSLIFPIRSGGDLLAWTARNFHPNDKEPKWRHSRADFQNILHILGWREHGDKPIVLVEDIVSAIVVSRVARACCLFGSTIPLRHLTRLRHLTKKMFIWLDGDKYREAITYSRRPAFMGLETQVIFTELDPKQHSEGDIKSILQL